MKKEKTTEPEVELKLKKGGKAKMAMGGNPMIAQQMPMRGAPMAEKVMSPRKRMAMQPALLTRKKGGTTKYNEGGMAKGEGAVTDYESKKMSEIVTKPVKKAMGGEVESPKMHKSEMKQMGKIEKELKSHENKPASKAHKGLKTGGVVQKFATGGTTSSKIANKFVNKMDDGSMPKNKVGKTGGMNMPGYKDGGHVAMTCKNEGGYTQMKKMSKC